MHFMFWWIGRVGHVAALSAWGLSELNAGKRGIVLAFCRYRLDLSVSLDLPVLKSTIMHCQMEDSKSSQRDTATTNSKSRFAGALFAIVFVC